MTRKKYNHDIIFKITKIEEGKAYLCGENIRLFSQNCQNGKKQLTITPKFSIIMSKVELEV